jgi:hypothetical protein
LEHENGKDAERGDQQPADDGEDPVPADRRSADRHRGPTGQITEMYIGNKGQYDVIKESNVLKIVVFENKIYAEHTAPRTSTTRTWRLLTGAQAPAVIHFAV